MISKNFNSENSIFFFFKHLFFKIIKYSKSLKFDSHSVVGRFDNIFLNCFTTLLLQYYIITISPVDISSKISFKVAAVISPSGTSSVGLM